MKKKKNWFLITILITFIIFLGMFISSVSGYHDSAVSKRVALTDEKIKEFEEDVLNGEVVDIKDYIEKDNRDYSNGFTKAGEKVSDSLTMILTEGINSIWDALRVLFF